MDHLPHIHDPAYPPLLIPCLCDPLAYDNNDWREYPERSGWEKVRDGIHLTGELKHATDNGSHTTRDFHAFMQSWCFFGLLVAVFAESGLRCDVLDFVRRDPGSGQQYITTAALPGYLDEWARAVRCATEERFKTIKLKKGEAPAPLRPKFTEGYLLTVHDYLLGRAGFPRKQGWKEDQEVELSLVVLYETLNAKKLEIFGFSANLMYIADEWKPRPALPRRLVVGGMERWCPSEVTMLKPHFDNSSLYVAGRLGRPNMIREHKDCTFSECLSRQVDEGTYESKHVLAGCTCQVVEVDVERVTTILQLKKVPRIGIGLTEGGVGVELVVADTGDFTAISHVWQDGLGNPHHNALPACQLRRLREMCLTLLNSSTHITRPSGYVYLWIDTLAVPLQKAGRILALSQLRKAYDDSTHVLVLDAELCSAYNRWTHADLLLRISLSGWLRRLWTLEEGVAAGPKVRFQLFEGPLALPSLDSNDSIAAQARAYIRHALPDRNDGTDPFDFGKHGPHRTVRTRGPVRPTTNRLKALVRLAPALEFRTTSKAEDETICLASLIGISTAPLLAYRGAEERILRFWSLVGIPDGALFAAGGRLQGTGRGWAPRGFLGMNESDFENLANRPENALTAWEEGSGGLVVTFRGLWLSTDRPEGLKPLTYFRLPEVGGVYEMSPAFPGRGEWTVEETLQALQGEFKGSRLSRSIKPAGLASWRETWTRVLGKEYPNLALIAEEDLDIGLASYRALIVSVDPRRSVKGPVRSEDMLVAKVLVPVRVIFNRLWAYEVDTFFAEKMQKHGDASCNQVVRARFIRKYLGEKRLPPRDGTLWRLE